MQDNRRITNILKEVKKIKSVKAVYLFGSYSTQKQLPFSDIDICIIGNLSEKEKSILTGIGSEKFHISFFDEMPIYIKFDVLKGRQIFCRDEEYIKDLVFHTLKEYFDFQPLLKRFEKFYFAKHE